jgi:hypothetical protein
MMGYTAIAGWVADVPLAILADLYLRSGATPAPPPSKTTIWRILTDAARAFDVAVGTWLMKLVGFTTPTTASRDTGEEDCSRALMPVGLDGKAIRRARDVDGNQAKVWLSLAGLYLIIASHNQLRWDRQARQPESWSQSSTQ